MPAFIFVERRQRARNTHSSERVAALQVAQYFNGSNLRYTGHSSKRSRMAVLARITVIAKSQGAVFDFNCSEQGCSQSNLQRNVGCRFSLSFELFALSFELFDR